MCCQLARTKGESLKSSFLLLSEVNANTVWLAARGSAKKNSKPLDSLSQIAL